MLKKTFVVALFFFFFQVASLSKEKAKANYALHPDQLVSPTASFFQDNELVVLYVMDSLDNFDLIRLALVITIDNGEGLNYPVVALIKPKMTGKTLVSPVTFNIGWQNAGSSSIAIFNFLPRPSSDNKAHVNICKIKAKPTAGAQLNPGGGVRVMLIKALDCLGSSKEEQASYLAEFLGYLSQDDVNHEKAKKEDEIKY